MNIRKILEEDFKDIWKIFKLVIEKGDTYIFSPDTNKDVAYSYWYGEGVQSYVVEDKGKVLGMYKIIANQPDLGSHIANASFMVSSDCQGKGIGRTMGLHSLKEAKKMGFQAIQFNFVVSTNINAVKLWESLGFKIIGTLPKVFNHLELGYVDAYIMFRSLDDIEVHLQDLD